MTRLTDKHSVSRATHLLHGRAYNPAALEVPGVEFSPLKLHHFGAVAAADPNGVCQTQALNASAAPDLNGDLVADGVAVFDTPRNVVAAWTNAAVITVTCEDQYGERFVESSSSGTSFTGSKAAKRVLDVRVSANVTGLTVGSGVVLGLPHRVAANGLLLALVDNGLDANPVFAPADDTEPATATTDDVRGTITFDDVPDGASVYSVLYQVADVRTKKGAYGVDQFAG